MKSLLLASFMLFAGCSQLPEAKRDVAQARGREFGYYFTRNINNNRDNGNISFARIFRNPEQIQQMTAPFIKGALVEINKTNPRARGTVDFFHRGNRIESLFVTSVTPVQHVYISLNIPTLEIGDISLRFDPLDFSVRSITLMLNDEQVIDWGGRDSEFGVIYKNTISNMVYFGKSFSDIDAEYQARSACEAQSYANSCRLFKRETIVAGFQNLACKIKNTISNKFYLGEAPSLLEAEFLARNACSKESYNNSCADTSLECSNPNERLGEQVCMVRNSISNKSYLGKGDNAIRASFEAQRLCAAQSYANSCSNATCEQVDTLRRQRPFVCLIENPIANKSYRGTGATRLEAEYQGRNACEANSYANSCRVQRCD
jgi:hypothetical protein